MTLDEYASTQRTGLQIPKSELFKPGLGGGLFIMGRAGGLVGEVSTTKPRGNLSEPAALPGRRQVRRSFISGWLQRHRIPVLGLADMV